jgi:hypothetical protein
MSDIRIGMVGLDTSHCTAFADIINNPAHLYHLPGAMITHGFPGGSAAFSQSHTRVDKFTMDLATKFHVEIVQSLEEVAENVDAILLESCDGRQHLEQFRILAPFKKPVFIDKPFACSLADAKKIANLAKQYQCPIFSASSLRYSAGITDFKGTEDVAGVVCHGPVEILSDYPGYYWYGIHLAEIIYRYMGRGCERLQTAKGELFDITTCRWDDDRAAVMIGYRGLQYHGWGGIIYTNHQATSVQAVDTPPAYMFLLQEVLKFFKTRVSPVSPDEMVEITSFLDSVNQSRDSGEWVDLIK